MLNEDMLRAIENKVDVEHKKYSLFKKSRDYVILNLLRVFEDFIRLGGMATMLSSTSSNVFINSGADWLDMAMKWAYECCESNEPLNDLSVDSDIYMMIAEKISADASKYRGICDAFCLYSRNKQNVKMSKKGKRIEFQYTKSHDGKYEAYDFIRNDKEKNNHLNNGGQFSIMMKLEKLRPIIKSDLYVCEDEVSYKLTDEKWSLVSSVVSEIMSIKSELPDDWQFEKFTLGDLKKLWHVFLCLAFIHNLSCMSSNAAGAGIKSSIMLKKYDEIEKIVLERSDLSAAKVKSMIDFLTYNSHLINGDVIWQPLILLNSNDYAISPSLIMTSNFERNFISLINKVDQKSYSRLSSGKETIMMKEISEKLKKYSSLKIEFSVKLPEGLPDIDMLIFDEKSKCVALCEMKWLIETDSIQEVCARDEDIKKGIKQAEDINEYFMSERKTIIERTFKTVECEIETVCSCVITRNNVGTSLNLDSIGVINENTFIELFECNSGDLSKVINHINEREYLPKIGKDYNVKKQKIRYAGFEFIVDCIEMINNGNDVAVRQQRLNKNVKKSKKKKEKMSKASKKRNRF